MVRIVFELVALDFKCLQRNREMRSDDEVVFSFSFSLVLSLVLCFQTCFARDTLNAGEKITLKALENLVSSNLTFTMGFFSEPGESGSRNGKNYLGIWYYKLQPLTVVWVANTKAPVEDSSGVFQIAKDGNLVVADASSEITYWTSGLDGSSSKNRQVKLLDSGNLVLMDESNNYLWQSFQNPTDTFLPGMKMDGILALTSWRHARDPTPGDFTFALLATTKKYQVRNQSSQIYWVLDRSDTQAVPTEIFKLLDNNTSPTTPPKISHRIIFRPYNYEKSRLLLDPSGKIQFFKWDEDNLKWDQRWSGPGDKCDLHDYCGSFSICNKNNLNLNLSTSPCKCLPGFSDEDIQEKGCGRKSPSCIDTDVTFLNLTNIKLDDPDQSFFTETKAECQSQCLKMCLESQCQAYSYNMSTYNRASLPCKIWTRNLPTLLEDYHLGLHLSIRVTTSDIAPTAKSCEPCGPYIIPYPLRTRPNCGDPMYNYFNCTKSTGQVSFLMPGAGGKSFQVTLIDQDTRMFFIQTSGLYSCNSSFTYKKNVTDFPFNITECIKDVGIKINWLPAPEPPCSKQIDCKIWPNSTCGAKGNGGNRCLCDLNYKWNDSILSCTQVHFLPKQAEPSKNNHSTHRLALILTVILTGMAILACIVAFAIVRRKKRALKRDRASTRIQESLYETEKHVKGLIGLGSLEEKDIEGVEVPCYTFASIVAATDNFSDSNKLGRGGYGPVYKGTFPGGQDIAVKRLASVSTQGLQEFMNEVILIAKLQHRNLVRLRGYCIKGNEKILLYEYMPNKSLDSFIFDPTGTPLLDWPMRFEIIVGIARGMLYLHQDSRLRVIHRDLKTSNILLDEEMNPKISDFGLAKIFGGKETEASTERVVGTYGYMAPEYALDGHFSTKSDVFSFGVVLLEILSGKKNTGFYQSKQISSILGYAWKLWTENKLLDLMDPSIGETCNENQFIKCAVIGLLCIQDEPGDRPTMSNVLSMLDIETSSMPIPTQPTFFVNKQLSSQASPSTKPEISLQFDSSYQEGR